MQCLVCWCTHPLCWCSVTRLCTDACVISLPSAAEWQAAQVAVRRQKALSFLSAVSSKAKDCTALCERPQQLVVVTWCEQEGNDVRLFFAGRLLLSPSDYISWRPPFATSARALLFSVFHSCPAHRVCTLCRRVCDKGTGSCLTLERHCTACHPSTLPRLCSLLVLLDVSCRGSASVCVWPCISLCRYGRSVQSLYSMRLQRHCLHAGVRE